MPFTLPLSREKPENAYSDLRPARWAAVTLLILPQAPPAVERFPLWDGVLSQSKWGAWETAPPPTHTPRSLSNAYDLLFGWRTRRHILHVWLLGHLSLRPLSSTFLAQKEQASPSLFCLTRNPHVIFLHVLRPVNPRPGCPRQRVLGKELHLNALDLHLYESCRTIKS